MRFDIITIFPSIFASYFSESIVKRAQEKGLINITVHNLRDYTTDKHKTVDDTPYGGGAGMVLKVEPIYRCVNAIISNFQFPISNKIKNFRQRRCACRQAGISLGLTKFKKNIRIILFSAKGKRYTQEDAVRLAEYDNLILICGRYEGVDERVAEYIADEEISIGDYVLTGGEIPAMAVVDSVTRLIPGVVGNEESIVTESFSEETYLEHPQYTKPEEFQSWKVPEVLLSGNHKEIEEWRKKNAKNSEQ